MNAGPSNASTVFVVDDDAAVRDGLSMLVESAGFAAETYGSAEAFLEALPEQRPACLVLDMRMSGMSGLELQAQLVRRAIRLPIIFLTAHGDIPASVQAMKAGAADFLTKPVDGAQLLERVQAALVRSREDLERDRAAQAARARLSGLTEQEHRILALALAGHSNKEIARHLGISFRTVEVHRSRILLKTGAGTLLELARLTAAGGLAAPHTVSPPTQLAPDR